MARLLIGQIGFDPGTEWGSGLISTQNNTLRRKSSIVTGDTNPFDTFDPSLEWEGFAQDTFSAKISAIQGTGNSSPLVGETVLIEAIATADFQGSNGLAGFFVQEEDADIDTSLQTSEGIFIADGNSPAVDINIGDLVRITGIVSETDGLTQLTDPNVTIVSSDNPLPTATTINNLAAANSASLEPYEGMQVQFSETLTVSEYYQLGRFGQITLSSNGRETQFTHNNAPSGAGYNAHKTAIVNSRIILDDGSETTSPNPIIFGRGGNPLSATNLLRGGDTVNGLSGILDYRQNNYRVQTNSGVNFNAVNQRNSTPPDVGVTLKVASFNLQNYFTTIDDGSNGARGADSAAELTRQTDKLVAALTTIDADIVGLMELENNGYGSGSAIQALVNSLNTAVGAGTYDFVNPGLSALGSDDIAVGFIYKPGQVDLIGAAATKSDGAFANFNRQPLVQTFAEKATGEKLTVAVNHFKSKGSSTGFTQDNDQGDGQGNSNFTRTQAAQELSSWLVTDPTNSNDPDFLIIGDLNAYAQEDPIATFKNAGYTNLIDQFNNSDAYSFIYDGQLGYLDHALGNESLTSQVTGVGEWHINADEPNVFDYNETNIASLYQANPFRSSDHDPVILGLNLNVAPVLDNTGSPESTAINEDEVNPNETLVADLISGIFNESNPNNTVGIAVTAVNNNDGDWQYSLDGITWLSFGNPSQTNARLLSDSAKIRFLPASNFNGVVNSGITFRAWDGTSGNNGASADTSDFGGNTAFSVAQETASITVNPVNDAPSFVPGANQTVNQDAGSQVVNNWVSNISPGGGDDEATQSLLFNVSNNNPGLFTGQPAIDSQGTLTFTPAANAEGTATVFVSLTDDGGTANGGVDTSVVQSFTIAVNSVATDNSAADNSATDNSATDNSATDNSATDNSAADNSATDNSATDNSATDNSATDNSATDNSTTDNSATDNSATDNSTTDNSATDNSATDNSATDNSATDNSATDNSAAENAATDNSAADNSAADNSAADNSATDNSAADVATDNSATDNSATDNSAADNSATDVAIFPRPPLTIAPISPSITLPIENNLEIFLSDYIPTSSFGDGILESPYGMNQIVNGDHHLDDNIKGEGLNEAIAPLGGDDFIRAMEGNDFIDGGEGNDTLNGNQQNDFVNGGLGNDSLHGGKNNDTVNGGMGNDVVRGDFGDDILDGWQDDDFLNGNQNNDWLDGGEGNDVLHGGKNEDTLIGGKGDDWLFGDLGNDSLMGGSGEDVFVLEIGRGSDAIADFTDAIDKIGLAGGLTVDQLTILASNNHTLIKVGEERLATLYNIDANQITSQDFLLVG
jgi:predicted extracellular nuclease/Ca2+-binding RTX toxin-like protein